MMPGMDGFELCRRIKLIADLPIIVLSAVAESEAKVNALELYAEDYVTKPFVPDELIARIQRVLPTLGAEARSSPWTAGTLPSTSPRRRSQRRPGTNSSRGPSPVCSRCSLAQPTGSCRLTSSSTRSGPIRTAPTLLPVGHRSPPAPQDRARPRRATLPDHRTRHRIPVDSRILVRPASLSRCRRAASGCASSSGCSSRSCLRSYRGGRRRRCSAMACSRRRVPCWSRLPWWSDCSRGRLSSRSSSARSLGDEFRDLLALARGDNPGAPSEVSAAAQRMTIAPRRAQPAGRGTRA